MKKGSSLIILIVSLLIINNNLENLAVVYYRLALENYKENKIDKSVYYLEKSLDKDNNFIPSYDLLKKIYLHENRLNILEKKLILLSGRDKELKKKVRTSFKREFRLLVSYGKLSAGLNDPLKGIKDDMRPGSVFNYKKYAEYYNDNESLNLFSKQLDDFYYYNKRPVNEIIGQKIMTSLIIGYKIKDFDNIIEELAEYLKNNVVIEDIKLERYQGYFEKLKDRRSFDLTGKYVPLIIKVKLPYLFDFIFSARLKEYRDMFNDGVSAENLKTASQYFERLWNPEYRDRFDKMIFKIVYVESAKMDLRSRKKMLAEYIKLFPESKYINTIEDMKNQE